MNKAKHKKVSVITPAYNAESFIGRTIQSVVEQTFTNWEMIIVDDCSTDKTIDIVNDWTKRDPRIRLHSLEINFGGPAGPRNVGVKIAEGEYVAFLDADDIWHPNKLEVQLEVLNFSAADFVCSNMKDFIDEKDIDFKKIEGYKLQNISFAQQSLRARIPTSSVILKRELAGLFSFEESPKYKAVEDYHCWLRLLEKVPSCIKVHAPLLLYRKVEGQISGSKLYMMGRVFMVHREYSKGGLLRAVFLTITHVVGGLYFRYIQKGM